MSSSRALRGTCSEEVLTAVWSVDEGGITWKSKQHSEWRKSLDQRSGSGDSVLTDLAREGRASTSRTTSRSLDGRMRSAEHVRDKFGEDDRMLSVHRRARHLSAEVSRHVSPTPDPLL